MIAGGPRRRPAPCDSKMYRSQSNHSLRAGGSATSRLLAAVVAAMALVPVSPAAAAASSPRPRPVRTVVYDGYRMAVPASWPVFDLAASPRTCVRFNRHAVYLGVPGNDQLCQSSGVGRTEAILVSPLVAAARAALPASAAGPGGQSQMRLVDAAHRVVVVATWDRDPGLIRRALGLRSLAAAVRAADRRPASEVAYAQARVRALRRRPGLARAASYPRSSGGATAPPASAPATPGAVYTGPGFDACSTPSTAAMTAWGSSPYRAIGVYIGGANMACAQQNLNATWVSQESAAGWHLIPIYVGLQVPGACSCSPISTSPATAGTEGTAAAQNAVADAQAVGIGTGNPIYLDLEGYPRTSANTAAALAFEAAWTSQLHAEGYYSGIYSSANSGIADLVSQYGTAYTEPDELWIARWNDQQTTADPNVPPAEWADHQRLHQYSGAHNETYQGRQLNIDGDWIDATTAAAGTGSGIAPAPAPAPSLTVKAGPDGSVSLSPSWPYEPGIAAWRPVGGPSPSALGFAAPTVPAGSQLPIVLVDQLPYWAIQALGSSGQVLGTSAPVAEPSELTIFGASAFVPRKGLAGVPVSCFAISPCTVTTTVSSGRRTLATTGPEHLGAGRGLVFFKLSPADQALLAKSAGRQTPIAVTVRDQTGDSVTRPLTLTSFETGDPNPPRRAARSSGLQFIGLTEFVSHGWVGGVLASCNANVACDTTTTLVAGHRTIARSAPQMLGAGEVGYLFFTLTRYGHGLLMHAPGNQLGTYATLNAGGAFARAHVVLVAFP